MINKKAEIYNCAKELFSSKGYKNTNVSDITKMAGIAAGTFYNYYASKDKLFVEIYSEENAKLKKNIMESINIEADPLYVMKKMMFLNHKGMNSNPILREWYNKDVYQKIEQIYRDENGLEHVDFLYDSFTDLVKKWQAEGKMMNDIDAGTIMAIFSALINMDSHKEEIGLSRFPQAIEYMAELIMKGLTDCSKKD